MNKPKVFISYSWTSPQHKELVRQWADRLFEDGIEVIIDIYDLREGNDKYAFMEKMVTDPTITHVLVICDQIYANKADRREAGVGTESEIISSEVYDKEQSKFIPIVCEFNETGSPTLPTFMTAKIWIDFSSLEATNKNWEQLVRLLYGKPQYTKPKMGNAPAYITSKIPVPTNATPANFNSLKQTIDENKGNLQYFRNDFINACISHAEDLRVRQRPDIKLTRARVQEDCNAFISIRNYLCDWISLESDIVNEEAFSEMLVEVIEKLLNLRSNPPELNSWHATWVTAHSVFTSETFLYIVAALLKSKAYKTLHEIYHADYILNSPDDYGEAGPRMFDCFYGYSEKLRNMILTEEGGTYVAPAAELVKRNANRNDILFSDIRQAELLTLLITFITPKAFWYPQTLLYSPYQGNNYPFFIRAKRHKYFLKLATITGISSAGELRKKVREGNIKLNTQSWYRFRSNRDFWSQMNMDKLDTE